MISRAKLNTYFSAMVLRRLLDGYAFLWGFNAGIHQNHE